MQLGISTLALNIKQEILTQTRELSPAACVTITWKCKRKHYYHSKSIQSEWICVCARVCPQWYPETLYKIKAREGKMYYPHLFHLSFLPPHFLSRLPPPLPPLSSLLPLSLPPLFPLRLPSLTHAKRTKKKRQSDSLETCVSLPEKILSPAILHTELMPVSS